MKKPLLKSAQRQNPRLETGLYFKKLGVEDAGAVCALEQACFSLPWSLAQCRGALAQKAFAAFGLWRQATLVAYVSFYHAGCDLEIVNLAVAPTDRRQGHGERILGLLLQAGHKMGMQKALLEVRESNFAAIALYEKCGFSLCGKRPRYYTDSGENALIYSRVL